MSDLNSDILEYILTSNMTSYELEALDVLPLGKDQAIYVFDLAMGEIAYSRGVENLLGYTRGEFDMDLVSQYFHPHDQKRMEIIMKASIQYATSNVMLDVDSKLFLNSRIRHKKGHFVHVFRQTTVFNSNERGEMTANFSLLSNIDFIPFSGVGYSMDANGNSVQLFDETVKNMSIQGLTKREKQIFTLLKAGLSSQDISKQLFVSKNTVDTHRRNMLKKTSCKNTVELIAYLSGND